MDWLSNLGVIWLILAVALALAELAAPGVFLIFIAMAAAITGVTTLLFPSLGLAGGLVSLGAWSIVSVLIGRRWYRDYPVETSDPKLNNPAARLVGRHVTIVEWNSDNSGRARLGDSVWPAQGKDADHGMTVGQSARIDSVRDGVLEISPLPLIAAQASDPA